MKFGFAILVPPYNLSEFRFKTATFYVYSLQPFETLTAEIIYYNV